MSKYTLFILSSLYICICVACTREPSKVELMRQKKNYNDSITYIRAIQNIHYSDSALLLLQTQSDSLMTQFVYSKHEKAEDHGHYVHRSLQTTSNSSRNFLQAYIADNHKISLQSYYYGSQQIHQRAIQISLGNDFIKEEGTNHAFDTEGWHEILTIEDEAALRLLAYIATHANEHIQVTSIGTQSIVYYPSLKEKQALSATYQLAVVMRNIDALERAIHVSNLQIQKYEKKHMMGK